MSSFTWYARDRNVSGLSESGLTAVFLPWSPDPGFAGQSLPWAAPEYPTLWITGIGVTLTTSGVAGARRISLRIDQVGGASLEWLSLGTQTATLTRRFEFAQGVSLETTLASSVYREALPRGFMLLPGVVGGVESQLTVAISNVQAGDSMGGVTVRGVLLYP